MYEQAGKGFIYFVTLRLISQGERTYIEKENENGSYRYVHCAIAGDVNNKRKLLGFSVLFTQWLLEMVTGCHVKYALYNEPRALRGKLKRGFF